MVMASGGLPTRRGRQLPKARHDAEACRVTDSYSCWQDTVTYYSRITPLTNLSVNKNTDRGRVILRSLNFAIAKVCTFFYVKIKLIY